MKTSKKVILGSSLLIVVAAILWIGLSVKNTASVSVQTATAVKGSVVNTVTATGTVEPITQVEVGTQVSGVINKIYVDYNSVVKKGQLIAELDETLLASELAQVNANLESAENDLDFQTRNFNRYKLLYEKKSISEADYENAYFTYVAAKAKVDLNMAEMERAQTNLSYAKIHSPIDGVVLSRAVDEGQTVAASFNTPTLFTIAQDLTRMQVIADVDEADIGQVKEGQRVIFTVDAYPDDEFSGTVSQIRLEAQVNSSVVTYNVVIEAPNPDLKLMPGLTASITVFILEENDVLTIPSKALQFVPDSDLLVKYASQASSEKRIESQDSINGSTVPQIEGNADRTGNLKTVWIRERNGIAARDIMTGNGDGTIVQVISGLNEGDEVVLSLELSKETGSDSAAGSSDSTDSSPFMPKRPEENKK